MKSEDLLLYAVTDRSWLCAGESLADKVSLALSGGATCIQLREKDMPKADFLAEARLIRAICRSRKVPFIVNDDPEIAVLSGADGVHVGLADMSVKAVRKMLPENSVVGASVQNVAQAVAAESDGATYLGVGAVFHTNSKADAEAVDLETLREICSAVKIPVVAIGGICLENISLLAGRGLAGIAAISAIFAARDIARATRTLKEKALEVVRRR